MESRPELVRGLDSKTFREYYYLKEELLAFCRANHLPVSGGKQELTERIACFLDTGEIREPVAKRAAPRKKAASEITRESIIEDGFAPLLPIMRSGKQKRPGRIRSESNLNTTPTFAISLLIIPGRRWKTR